MKKTSTDITRSTRAFSTRRRTAARAFSAAALLATLTPGTGRAATSTFNTANSLNLNDGTKYSAGTVPDATTDISLLVAKNAGQTTASPLALTLPTGPLVAQSFNISLAVTSSTNFLTIQNTTAGNNTITLGSPTLNNGVGGTTSDLIYLKTGTSSTLSLSLLGTNGSGGTLGLVLASSGSLNTAVNTTLTIGAAISGNFNLSKAGTGVLNLNAANTVSGLFTASGGTTNLGSDGALGSVSGLTVAATAAVNALGNGSTNLINDTALVTLNGNASNGAVLNLAGATETIGSLANSVSNGAKTSLIIGDNGATAGSFTVGDSNSTTFAGVISGSRASAGAVFTKQGTGTLTLTGANTFTGGVAINGGILNLGVAEVVNTSGPLGPAGAISFGGGTLQYSTANNFDYSSRFSPADNQVYRIDTNSQTVTFASPLAGNGSSLSKIGAGTLILSNGASTFTGGVVLNAGIVRVTGAENAGTSGPLGASGPISFQGGALQFSATNLTDYSSRFSTAANQAFIINTNAQTVEFLSPLTSSGGSLTKASTGTLILSSSDSTFNAGVTLTAGTLRVNAAEVPGVSGPLGSAGTILFNGGTLQYSASNVYDYSSRFSTADNQSFNINTNTQNVTFASTLVSNNGTLTKSSTGNLILSGANTFNGGVTLNGGTIRLNSAEIFGVSGPLGSGGTITLGGGTLQYSASNNFDYSARFSTAANQAYIINTNTVNVTFATALTSSGGSLTKSAGGVLTLAGANTFNGGVTLTAGTLALGVAENAGVSGPLGSAGTITLGGGTLQFSALNGFDYSPRFSTAATQAYNIDTNGVPVTLGTALTSVGGTLTKTGTGTLTLGGANTFNGNVNVNAGTLQLRSAEVAGTSGPLGGGGTINLNGGTLQFPTTNNYDYSPRFSTAANQTYAITTNAQTTVTFASALTSSGGTLTKTGTGTLILTGANTFNGTATLTNGIINAGVAEVPNVSGPLGTGNTILFKGGVLQFSAANTYDYSSRFAAVGSQLYSVDTNGQNVSFATALNSNNGTLTKAGAGILDLPVGNTYNSGTTVTGGTLQISNPAGTSATGSGAVTINASATLQGTGYIDAGTNLITIRGTLSPGTGTGSFGSLNFVPSTGVGSMTLTSVAVLAFDLTDAANKDLIALGGSTLAINGGTLALTLPNMSSSGIDYAGTYAVFTGVTSLTGTGFAAVTGYDTADYQPVFTLNGTDYDLSFTAIPIPEPSALTAGWLIVGVAAWRLRGSRLAARRAA